MGGQGVRALCIGGKGFIGSHLAALLRERGVEVLTYDLKDGQDALDYSLLCEYVAAVDAVFDVAGVLGSMETFSHIERTVAANILGTVNVLKACEQQGGVPLVYLSLKTDWHNPYLITKRAASEFCLAYNQYRGLPVAVVRGLNVYGPGQHWGKVEKAVPTFIVKALRGEPLRVYGDGQQIADLIHVRDLCEVLHLVWARQVWGEVLDAGTGVPTTIDNLAALIVRLAGSRSLITHGPMRAGEPARGSVQLADPTRMVQRLGYYPPTRLEDGMAATVAWYREHYREVEDRG